MSNIKITPPYTILTKNKIFQFWEKKKENVKFSLLPFVSYAKLRGKWTNLGVTSLEIWEQGDIETYLNL